MTLKLTLPRRGPVAAEEPADSPFIPAPSANIRAAEIESRADGPGHEGGFPGDGRANGTAD